ncbi:hypothetical protein BGX38DRAFT_1276819 [Terfezia claveryi]|nr:hypothetical protein BGX38DRAFT_1276819 [Terfezia claveryi]
MSIPLVPRAGPNVQTISQKPRDTSVLTTAELWKRTLIPPLSKTASEGPMWHKLLYTSIPYVRLESIQPLWILQSEDINTPGNSNWQLSPESEDQPADTEDEGSHLKIIDEGEEADGSEHEQGGYVAGEEAVQYAKITLGEEIV